MVFCVMLVFGCSGGNLRTKYFAAARPKITSTSSVELEREERKTPFTDSKEDTLTFTQELDFRTAGWIYHPALAVYSLDLRPEYELQTTEGSGGVDRDDQLLFFGYTFDSDFFQYKPHGLKLFSSRNRSEFDSEMAEDSSTETSIDRAVVLRRIQPFATSITAERRESDFQGFNDSRERTYLARLDSLLETDGSTTLFKSEAIRQERDLETSSFTTDRILLSARNQYRFGDGSHLLSSYSGNLTSSDTTGDTTLLNASESLFLRHSRNFSSQYTVRYTDRDEEDFFSRTITGTGRLSHQLYENLTTRLLLDARREDFSDGEIENYEGDLDFRYRRRIPWGSIGLTNGYRASLEDNNFDAREVRDESLVLTGTSLAFLNNDNVDVASIVVTDLTGLTIYAEGIDYLVTQIGDSVAISRVGVGSSIPDGATVLVDYRFAAQAPYKFYNTTVRAGAKLELWDMVKLTYNFSRSEDHLISGTRPNTLADDTIHRGTAELRWRWTTTKAEYEDRNTTRNALSRWTLTEILSFRPSPTLSFALSASYSETDFTATGDETQQQDSTAIARWQPYRWSEFSLNAFSRLTRGDVQRTDEIGLVSRLQWRFGLWSGTLSYEFLHQEDLRGNQERDRQKLLFRLTRKFI